ncbi:MAG: rod shape-determining protein RodA [Coriobacteriia bacterium]
MKPSLDTLTRFVRRTHWPLLLSVAALLVYGSVVVSSATAGYEAHEAMVRRHVLGILLGLVFMAVAWAVDYRVLQHWSGPILTVMTLLLVAVMTPVFGHEAGGATSWLQVGGVRLFQPSEPAKLMLIVVLAGVIAQYEGRIDEARHLMRILAYLAVPLGLILLQPDLGTGLVFVAIVLGMLLVGGMKGRFFVALGLVGVLLGALVLQAGLLKDYQIDRLVVFINPEVDPMGAGYNLAQSKIAIGSGGLTGKGLGSGTQSNLNFLPERHTDFIFAVLGEELGFAGTSGLLLLYATMLVSALAIGAGSKDLYGTLVCCGIVSMWTFQILVNAGMTLGIMPITGIPLPFMSFGSSFMVTNLAAVGMLLSVHARRYGM